MSTHEYPKEMIDPGADAPVAPAEPMTWEQAVRKHITDPAYAERLLALPDDATAEQVHACVPRHHAPVASAGDKPATSEPVAWQWRRKGEPWSREQTWTHEVFATTDDSEVRALYTAPPDVQRDAERLHWLREWLVRHGLLHALFCQPEAGMKAGDFWVLRKPYIVNGDGCEGYGKTEDEAIDAAMAAKEPT